jgi:adhesin transport system membrane fusion protein
MNELSAIEEEKKIKEVETVGVQKEINALIVLYEEEIINEIANLQPKILELQTKIPAFMERLSDTKIISPINGKINKVFFNTVGAIVRDGEKLVEIVPTDESLEVKGYVDPKDIGLIEPGQSARLSLTAFDPSKYGFLSGELKKVSADAIFREETRSYMFEITTTIDRSSLPISNGETIPIYPGMIAQIDIIRGSRSILDYLWQPVSKTRDFAFRE